MSAIRVGRFSASPRARRFCAAADAALHYRRAARMYRYAPINADARHESRVRVGAGTAVSTAPVKEEYCHTAGGLHGSSYFKMLDDAAFFAAQSLSTEKFVVTTSFTTCAALAVLHTLSPPGWSGMASA